MAFFMHPLAMRGLPIPGPPMYGPPRRDRQAELQEYLQRYGGHAQQMGGQTGPLAGQGMHGRAASAPGERMPRMRGREADVQEYMQRYQDHAASHVHGGPMGGQPMPQPYIPGPHRAGGHRDLRAHPGRRSVRAPPAPGFRARLTQAFGMRQHEDPRARMGVAPMQPRQHNARGMSMPAAFGRLGQGLTQAFGLPHRGHQDATPFDGLKRLKVLGEGGEGRAELMRSKSGGKLLVLKTIQHNRQRGRPAEVEALQALQQSGWYRRIVHFIAAEYSRGSAFILLEYCAGGDLGAYMERAARSRSLVPVRLVLHTAIQLGEALAFLHHGIVRNGGRYSVGSQHEPIIHLDVKPTNILLRAARDHDGMPEVVLADFGISCFASRPRAAGTEGFMAPELQMNQVSTKADMYLYGVTIVSLIQGHGQALWPSGGDPRVLNLGTRFRGTGLTGLLQQCLQVDPRMRAKMNERSGLAALDGIRQLQRHRGR